ncbi:MAG: hypothetical protein PHT62_11655 [Desulfotomaculaceae bacterium]|nr:hypothetical protein [Desulfotomaculaceae bacterium]
MADIVNHVIFPVLIWVYTCLALREERQVIEEFGEEYTNYAKVTPAFIPNPAFMNSAIKMKRI